MLSGVFPETAGIIQTEWQAVAWMYSGIMAGAAVPVIARVEFIVGLEKPGFISAIEKPEFTYT